MSSDECGICGRPGGLHYDHAVFTKPTYTTEEGTVGYVIIDTEVEGPTRGLFPTMAEAVASIDVTRAAALGNHSIRAGGLRVFEVMGIDREAELDMAQGLALRHGHALLSDEAARELGPALAAAEEEVAAGD